MTETSVIVVYSEEGNVFHLRLGPGSRVPLCDPERERGMLALRRNTEITGSTLCATCEQAARSSSSRKAL